MPGFKDNRTYAEKQRANLEKGNPDTTYKYTDPNTGRILNDGGAPTEHRLALTDPNSGSSADFLYRGERGADKADIDRYRLFASQVRNREGVKIDGTEANRDRFYGQQTRDMGIAARGYQTHVLGQYGEAMAGRGESVAQRAFAQALQQQQAAQASAAASARGGGLARAAAQRQSMMASAQMGQNAAGQMATLRAQEIDAARTGYAGMAGQIRGGDVAMRGQDLTSEQLSHTRAFDAAKLEDQQRARNDAAWLATESLGQDVAKTALEASMAKQNAIQADAKTEAQIWADAEKTRVADREASTNVMAAYWNMLSSGAGAMAKASDERVKKNVKPADKKLDAFLDALKAHDYDYKNPEAPGASPGRNTSVMAQELERSELGRRMVVDTPDGKVVDYGKGFATMLAAQAKLNSDVDALKRALGKRKAA